MSPPPDQTTADRTFEHPHVDEDTLALVALGEPADPWVADHVAGCVLCRAEVDSYARAVRTGLAVDASDGPLVQPPVRVWDSIVAELGLTSTGAVAREPVTPVAAAVDLAAHPRASIITERDADVIPLAPRSHDTARAAGWRSSSRTGLLVAASVVSALLGIGATLGWQALGSDEDAVVASAPLAPLPTKVGTGEAELHGTGDNRELTMTLDIDAPPDGYLQVWLMSPDATRMVPVGVIENGDGFWRVPADLDLAQFPLVDVSVEPFDGNEAHSGDSVVRGTLQG